MKGKKGNASVRKAKKDPAKRRSKQQKAIEESDRRAEQARERAAQFAAGRSTAEMPPFMANDSQYAGAAAVWRYHEPLLKERNFWGPEFVAPFTGFCIYYDEFLAADREVKSKGWGVEGKSTSGGHRFWRNPAVDVRDHAFGRVMELSSRYAFTPLDLYKLERESAAATSARPGSRDRQADELPLDQEQSKHSGGPGALATFDSDPPPGRVN